jgi:hypothetical protein
MLNLTTQLLKDNTISQWRVYKAKLSKEMSFSFYLFNIILIISNNIYYKKDIDHW